MPVNVMTDAEIDRAVSMRISRSVPLPPKLCLCDRYESRAFYRSMTYYQAYGLEFHPVVRLLAANRIESAMAASISRSASYLDRINHYAAWLGNAQPVGVLDSRTATPDHPAATPVAVGPTDLLGVGLSPCQTGRGAPHGRSPGDAVVRLLPRRSASGGADIQPEVSE